MKRITPEPIELESDVAGDVIIGSGALRDIGKYCKSMPNRRGVFAADARLKRQAISIISKLRGAGWDLFPFWIPVKESAKSPQMLNKLFRACEEAELDRASTMFAFGGGVVGDLVGFAAATYMRGVPWIGLPTTLLAQVDSSLGGKTGINFGGVKNLIGSFHLPSLVISDPEVLQTLDRRDIVSGYGEMLKHAIAFDRLYFAALQRDLEPILARDTRALEQAIEPSVRWKLNIVACDPYEQTGERKKLNLGHTFCHALESATKYRRYRHGEAVLWGLRFESILAHVCGELSAGTLEEIEDAISHVQIPPLSQKLSLGDLIEFMKRDKKNEAGEIKFVLPTSIGSARTDRRVNLQQIKETWKLLTGKAK